jgi:hypothetical protein
MTPRDDTGVTRRDLLLVGGAWLVLVVVLSVWLAIDRKPPAWEEAGRLERALHCADDLGRRAWSAMLDRGAPEPPLVPCAAGAVYRLYPSDVAAAQSVILVALGLGMAATYLLARDLGGVGAAVPAAWIVGAAPLMLSSALTFGPDVPLAATVAVALLALSRTDRLTRIGMSLAVGVLFGLGMLVKPVFALYVVGPVLWLLALERTWRAALNLGVAVVVAAAISLPWYGPRVLLPAATASPAMRSTASQYAAALVPQLGVLTIVLVIVGIVLAALHARGFAIVALVVPLAVVALGGVDRASAALPLLPAAAVLAGMAIAALPGPARLAGLLVVALVGAVQLSGVTWGIPKAIALPVLDVPWVVASPPSPGDWRQRDMLRAIANDSGGRPLTIGVLADHAAFSASNFRYYTLRDRLPFRVVAAWETDPVGIDYVVVKTGDVGSRRTAEAGRRAAEQLARDPALARAYPVLGDFPLPDGSTASLRVRRIGDGVAAAPDALAGALEAAIRRQLAAAARDVDNLVLRVEHDADLVRGRVKRIELSADSAVVADYRRADAPRLRVRRLVLVADDVLVNPFSLEAGRAELLDIARLRVVRAEVSGDDIQAFLGQLKSFRRTRVRLTNDAVYVSARQPGADVSAVLRPVPAADRRVALRVERAAIGWVPLPTALVNWLVRDYDPAGRLAAALPFAVELAPVAVTEHAVRVGD